MTNATARVELGRYAARRAEVTQIRDLLSLARAHHAAGSYAEGSRLAKGARTTARESLAAFRSMGARARAAEVRAWFEAHAAH